MSMLGLLFQLMEYCVNFKNFLRARFSIWSNQLMWQISPAILKKFLKMKRS